MDAHPSMKIDPAVLEALYNLGTQNATTTESTQRALLFLEPHGKVDRLHWAHWDQALESLPTTKLVAVIRGLVLAEEYHQWKSGSVAAAIWVFRNLKAREYADLEELTNWILAHTTNQFVPFGFSKYGAQNLAELREAAQRRGK